MDSCDVEINLSPIGVIIMNRNFIFGAYAAVCLVGFALNTNLRSLPDPDPFFNEEKKSIPFAGQILK